MTKQLENGHLMPLHPLTNFEIERYDQNKSQLNDIYSLRNLYSSELVVTSTVNDGAYVINLGEYKSVGKHRIPSYVNFDNLSYFSSTGVGHIPKKIIRH